MDISKLVNFEAKNSKVYLCIYNYVKNKNKLPPLSLLKISKQARYKYTSRLKKEGLIKRIGFGVWELIEQDKGKPKVNFRPKDTLSPLYKAMPEKFTSSALSRQEKNIRGHAFILTFKLPNIKNWENREKYLNSKNIKYLSLGIGGKTQQITFKGHKVWLASKSIILYSPKDISYFSLSAKESKTEALESLLGLFQGLERLLNVSLKFTSGYQFKVSRQHYAKVNDFFAKYMNEKNEKIRVSNSNGEWFIIDNSFNLNEAETVHKKSAVSDMDNIIKPFLNDLKDYYDRTGEPLKISEMLFNIFRVQQQTTRYQEENNEQIKKIIEVLQNQI